MKALIIEDDPKLIGVYEKELLAEGFLVDTARTGQDGLDSIRKRSPDVVVLDLILPELSGIEVLRSIRADHQARRVPVLVVSKTCANDILQTARQAGATEVLSKASCTPKQIAEVARNLTRPVTPTAAPSHEASGTGDAAPPPVSSDDEQFQAELRAECLRTGGVAVAAIRSSFELFSKNRSDTAVLHNLYRKVHTIAGNTSLAGLHNLAAVASALETVAKECQDRRDRVGQSVLRTMAQGIDLLDLLYRHPLPVENDQPPVGDVLAVEDDPIALRAVVYSIEKVRLKPTTAQNPTIALKMAGERPFDVILTDIEMPEMTGIDLCSRLRALSAYKTTPILFVTHAADYDHRAQACLSGGTDLIAKPFLFSELGLKCLALLVQGRIRRS